MTGPQLKGSKGAHSLAFFCFMKESVISFLMDLVATETVCPLQAIYCFGLNGIFSLYDFVEAVVKLYSNV